MNLKYAVITCIIPFDELPESYVIFITRDDILGYGLPIYHIDRQIKEINIAFQDEAHIIYVLHPGNRTIQNLEGLCMICIVKEQMKCTVRFLQKGYMN